MASAVKDSDKTELESQPPAPPPQSNLFTVDFSLRLLLFAATLVAILVMVTSKQTEIITVPVLLLQTVRDAKFQQSPAFIYFIVAMAVICFYSILTIVASLSSIFKPFVGKRLLLHLLLVDVLMTGVAASATGAATGVAYIGLKGNSHVGWAKVCGVFDKFCRHIGSSVAMSLLASFLLVFLVMNSAYSLYRRAH